MIIKNSNHTKKFIFHLIRNAIIGFFLILIALYIGMLGYHLSEKMSWVDSFANASMILSGMGPLTPINTVAGKFFAGSYALFSGLVFIVLISLIFIPILHYVFQKVHLEWKE